METLKSTRPTPTWAQLGPVIEREKITLEWTGEDWMAYIWHGEEFFGPTPLIAVERCVQASIQRGPVKTATGQVGDAAEHAPG